MSQTKSYSPDRFRIISGGHVNTGYGPGTFISVKELGDGITDVEGADGEIVRTIRKIRRLEITITLMQSSSTNDFYSAAYHADIASSGGGTFPMVMQDLNGTSVYEAAEAWVTKMPDADYAMSGDQTRSWVIRTGKASSAIVGGN